VATKSPNAGRAGEYLIRSTARDNFGVTRHDQDAAGLGRVFHAANNAAQRFDRQAFLKDQCDTQIHWVGARDSQVVDRTVNGEGADVPTWEEKWADYGTVGCHDELAAEFGQRRGVGERSEKWVRERSEYFLANQTPTKARPFAVRE